MASLSANEETLSAGARDPGQLHSSCIYFHSNCLKVADYLKIQAAIIESI